MRPAAWTPEFTQVAGLLSACGEFAASLLAQQWSGLFGNNKEAVWCIVYLGIALVITVGRYIVNRFLATATDEEAGIDKGGQGR